MFHIFADTLQLSGVVSTNLPGIHPCPLVTLIHHYLLFANASAYALALDIGSRYFGAKIHTQPR